MGVGTGGATGARAPLIFELTYRVVQKVPSKSVALPTSLSLIPRPLHYTLPCAAISAANIISNFFILNVRPLNREPHGSWER